MYSLEGIAIFVAVWHVACVLSLKVLHNIDRHELYTSDFALLKFQHYRERIYLPSHVNKSKTEKHATSES